MDLYFRLPWLSTPGCDIALAGIPPVRGAGQEGPGPSKHNSPRREVSSGGLACMFDWPASHVLPGPCATQLLRLRRVPDPLRADVHEEPAARDGDHPAAQGARVQLARARGGLRGGT